MSFTESALVGLCQLGVNEAGSSPRISTEMAQAGSLDVLARHLTRLRPDYGVTVRRDISTLIEQCKNYERGNGYLGRRMIETIERIEGKRG